jgi:AcrR family transcriptional regulator
MHVTLALVSPRVRTKERSNVPQKKAKQSASAASKARRGAALPALLPEASPAPVHAQQSSLASAASMPHGEPAGRRTQAERTAVSNSRLLAAAVKVIADKGYRAASLQAIGEVAGYSRGLVSHRFGSKEGLLKVLLKSIPDLWAERVRDISGLDALKATTIAHRFAITVTPDSVRALFMVMYEAQGELTELLEGFVERDHMHRERFEKILRSGQRDKTIRKDLDVPSAALIYFSVLRGLTMTWLMDREGVDLDKVYAEIDRLFARAFAPE